MQPTIRQAKPADAILITEFQIAMAAETENKTLDADVVSRGVENIFRDSGRGFYVVADSADQDQIVASCLITFEWSDWRNTNIWYLQSVYVVPESRGRGVFTRMFQFVRQQAADNGVSVLRLYVEQNNTSAQNVYRSLGMRKLNYDMYEFAVGITR